MVEERECVCGLASFSRMGEVGMFWPLIDEGRPSLASSPELGTGFGLRG
jgi:hypothetical protein